MVCQVDFYTINTFVYVTSARTHTHVRAHTFHGSVSVEQVINTQIYTMFTL